jgi:hypothetical protein
LGQICRPTRKKLEGGKNKKIRPKFIQSGDLVLRKIPKGKLKGKMHGKWEGPFIATTTSNEAAFKLRRLSDEEEPYTWNVDMLQKYFVRSRGEVATHCIFVL